MWQQAITAYSITGFTPTKIAQGLDWSDHGGFWVWGGYHAVFLVEEEWVNYNHNWHTANDKVSTFDWSQYVAVTKSLVA